MKLTSYGSARTSRGGFLQHLSANYKWRPNKVLLSERWALALCHMPNTRWLLHYVYKKFRWRPEVACFWTKTLDFTLVMLRSELPTAYKYLIWRVISQSSDNVSVRNTPKYFTESTNLMILPSRDSLGLKSLQYFTRNIMPYDLQALKTILCATVYFEQTASSSLSPVREGQKQHKSPAHITWLSLRFPTMQPAFTLFSLLDRSSI